MSSSGNEPPYQPPQQPFGSPPGGAPPPPPPPYAPAPTYGAVPGSYPATNPYDSRATTILVLGILGFVVCVILGVIAWVMGSNLKKEAEAAGYPEPGQAKAGRICGMIATLLNVAVLVIVVVALIIGAAASNS
jgi:heme/copper-type cytochrome/quinol oxidase subunit 4